jgi:hypothetical protein
LSRALLVPFLHLKDLLSCLQLLLKRTVVLKRKWKVALLISWWLWACLVRMWRLSSFLTFEWIIVKPLNFKSRCFLSFMRSRLCTGRFDFNNFNSLIWPIRLVHDLLHLSIYKYPTFGWYLTHKFSLFYDKSCFIFVLDNRRLVKRLV